MLDFASLTVSLQDPMSHMMPWVRSLLFDLMMMLSQVGDVLVSSSGDSLLFSQMKKMLLYGLQLSRAFFISRR